jgi:hypothetical protein
MKVVKKKKEEVKQEPKIYRVDFAKVKTLKDLCSIIEAIGVIIPVHEGNDTFDEVIKKGLLTEMV